MKLITLFIVFFAFAASSWGDEEATVSGLKVKRLSSGTRRPSGAYSASVDEHMSSGGSASFGYEVRPVGEQAPDSLSGQSLPPLRSLLSPEQKPFRPW